MDDDIPRFISRLYKVINNERIEDIRWNEEGTAFQIVNREHFIKFTLRLICKTSEYSSFVRQLNNYKFTKQKNLDMIEYYHVNFHRDRPELLRNIQRTHKLPVINPSQSNFHFQQQFKYLDETNFQLQKDIIRLEEQVEKQGIVIEKLFKMLNFKKKNNVLFEEHSDEKSVEDIYSIFK